MHTDADDRREQARPTLQPSRHEVHRNGPYLGIDGEAGVEYGDGTPEWLTKALQRGPRDSWRPQRDSWHAVRQSWETDTAETDDAEGAQDSEGAEDAGGRG
jgi:hypothetical protein